MLTKEYDASDESQKEGTAQGPYVYIAQKNSTGTILWCFWPFEYGMHLKDHSLGVARESLP